MIQLDGQILVTRAGSGAGTRGANQFQGGIGAGIGLVDEGAEQGGIDNGRHRSSAIGEALGQIDTLATGAQAIAPGVQVVGDLDGGAFGDQDRGAADLDGDIRGEPARVTWIVEAGIDGRGGNGVLGAIDRTSQGHRALLGEIKRRIIDAAAQELLDFRGDAGGGPILFDDEPHRQAGGPIGVGIGGTGAGGGGVSQDVLEPPPDVRWGYLGLDGARHVDVAGAGDAARAIGAEGVGIDQVAVGRQAIFDEIGQHARGNRGGGFVGDLIIEANTDGGTENGDD